MTDLFFGFLPHGLYPRHFLANCDTSKLLFMILMTSNYPLCQSSLDEELPLDI